MRSPAERDGSGRCEHLIADRGLVVEELRTSAMDESRDEKLRELLRRSEMLKRVAHETNEKANHIAARLAETLRRQPENTRS